MVKEERNVIADFERDFGKRASPDSIKDIEDNILQKETELKSLKCLLENVNTYETAYYWYVMGIQRGRMYEREDQIKKKE
jgi:hypothetical protein